MSDYRKPQAEAEFRSLDAKDELQEEKLKELLTSVKRESLPTLDLMSLPKMRAFNEETAMTVFLKSAQEEAEVLLRKTVQSEVITRLAEHADLSNWVEAGLRLHENHASPICEYCLQGIPSSRTLQLAHHFNEADKQLKNDLNSLSDKLRKAATLIGHVESPDSARLYSESCAKFETVRFAFKTEQEQLLSRLSEFMEEVNQKKSKSTQSLVIKTQLQGENLAAHLTDINKIIQEHNNVTAFFESVKTEAVNKLKLHYLSTIFDEVNSLDSKITELQTEHESLKKKADIIRERISKNMAGVSSEHKACDEINEKLCTFLGHRELRFAPRTEKKKSEKELIKDVVVGYDILRGDKPALYLSEGEKTAIAFVYFTVHLGDQNFDIGNGIILIDDPISSLDSNSLYQAFSFLKNAVKACKQVFILTHNFDFLQLIINWRKHVGGAGHYMIKNRILADVRCAYIDKMDKELYQHETEYHYLFKLLCQMKAEQDGSISKAYRVPNIARKVWDTFLLFRVPNGDSAYRKMDELKKAGFGAQKLDAIYKFVNDQSHITGSGFDPALVQETKKVLGEIFEMMAQISPEHYDILLKSVTDV